MLSVIIPAYNRAAYIAEAIRSVLVQTFQDFELIVVDDGSVDDTRKIVESFTDPRIRYIYQENRGVAAAQNTGIKASTGEYIAILGADDIWLPQNLEVKVKLLESRPDVALVCSDAYLFDDRTGENTGRFWHEVHGYWLKPSLAARQPLVALLRRDCFIPPQSAVIRRYVFQEVGLFDESLPTHEDWDLFVRIVRKFPIEVIDTPLARLRRHDTNLSRAYAKMYAGETAALKKAIYSYSLRGETLKLARKRLARTHFNYGRKLVLDGRVLDGLAKIFNAARVNPSGLRFYLYLALSVPGRRGILVYESVKNWLVQNLGHRRPAEDTRPLTS